ncbi:MAG: hypothetical protein V4506_15030 [Bacteroidota bacterium]
MKTNNASETFIEEQCTWIDWKEEIDDAVFSLKEKFPHYLSVFEDPNFVTLIENYNAEMPEDYVPALGQELSCHNIVLYEIEEDSDRYCLYMHAKDSSEEFEKTAKSQKIKLIRYLQTRKKWGDPAKRISLAGQIPFEKYAVKGGIDLSFPFSLTKGKWIDIGMDERGNGLYIGAHYSFVDLRQWKPMEHHFVLEYSPSGIHYYDYSETHQLCCAVFNDIRIDETNTRHIKNHIRISATPYDLTSWEEVSCDEEIDTLSKPFWVGEHVILCYKNKIWAIPHAAKGARICRLIKQTPLQLKDYYPSRIHMPHGETYLSVNSVLFKVAHNPQNTIVLEEIMRIQDPIHQGAVSFEEGRIIYVSGGKLIELDLKLKKVIRTLNLTRMDRGATIKKYNHEWLVIYRWGYTNKELDIAQFWHYKTNTWLKLSLGNLGKYGVRNILMHPDGYALIESDECILKVDRLLETLQANKKNHLMSPEWDQQE